MICNHTECERKAIGEAYYPGVDKWVPYCAVHLGTRKHMKKRQLSEVDPE